MRLIFSIIVDVFIIGLFLYSKLLPYKDKLNERYKKVFNFFSNFFDPALTFLRSFAKPFQVGQGISVDMSQVILLVLFLLLSKFI